jgi:ABC-type multidrug transport system fused ATPase/permease subunit
MVNFSEILAVIPNKYIRQIPLIIAAMIIGAGFEVLGISLIIPLMEAIIGQNNNILTQLIGSFYPGLSTKEFILISLAAFVSFYVIKGLYLSLLAWILGRFSYAVKAEISNNLMKNYLGAPYEFYLKRNSAQLIRNLTKESDQMVNNVLNPLLVIATESIVIICIGIFLIVLEPVGTIVVMALMFLFSYGFQRFLGNYMSKLGKIRLHVDGMLIQKSQESLGGIKDVKVLLKEEYFLKQFSNYNLILSAVSTKQHVLGQIPRMYLETIGVLFLSVLMLFLTLSNENFLQAIPALGVFSLAAFRLLPSFNRVISALNLLHFAEPVVINMNEQLNTSNAVCSSMIIGQSDTPALTFERSIEIQDLCYQYPGSVEFSLCNISLSIKRGMSIGIIGKSGAGKSTLADVVLGLLTPSSGAILVDGINIHENNTAWQQLIGYVQQDIFLLDDSIRRNIAFGLPEDSIDTKRMNGVVVESQLEEFISSLPDGLNTQLGERGVRLSGGQKQRIGIARALYRNSSTLIFDEATSALDNETESEIVSAINNLKGTRTIIVIAHRLSTTEHCDRVIELTDGGISKIIERNINS